MAPDQFSPSPVRADPQRRVAFLAALRESGIVRTAAARTGISPSSAYRMRRQLPEFAAAWDVALRRTVPVATNVDALEAVLLDRVINGVERRRLYAGTVVDTYREYPERLSIVMLQALFPDRYGKTNGGGEIFAPYPVVTREEFMARVAAAQRSEAAGKDYVPE
jgi:hypothetical protein